MPQDAAGLASSSESPIIKKDGPTSMFHFSAPGRSVPAWPCGNRSLVRGWFDQTLSAFLEDHTEPAAYLHIDSDLYSSAKSVLDLFAPRIRSGTVIVFDEFFNYPGWKEGEFKAFQEFVDSRQVRFEYAGYASADEQVAVIIR